MRRRTATFDLISDIVVLAMLTSVGFAGCGEADTHGRLPVSGKVTFQGSPLNQGSIEFVSKDGGQQTGATIENGKYSVPGRHGLPPGTYTVRIFSTEDAGSVGVPDQAPGPEAMEQQGRERIPPEYNIRSTLTEEVTESGRNIFDFQIP